MNEWLFISRVLENNYHYYYYLLRENINSINKRNQHTDNDVSFGYENIISTKKAPKPIYSDINNRKQHKNVYKTKINLDSSKKQFKFLKNAQKKKLTEIERLERINEENNRNKVKNNGFDKRRPNQLNYKTKINKVKSKR